jgi:hypothetical protein
MESPNEPNDSQAKQDQPKRISRWENLQRGKTLGENHPDPRTRLLLMALKKQEEPKQNEQKENEQPWDYEIMI